MCTFILFQTYIGDILVAVNPCKHVPLYDEQVNRKVFLLVNYKVVYGYQEYICNAFYLRTGQFA